MGQCLSSNYEQKLLDTIKKLAINALKHTLNRAIQKAEEATSDLIGNKIAEKITNTTFSKSTCEDPKISTTEILQPTEMPKESYMPPEERQEILISSDYYNGLFQKITGVGCIGF